jgi:hypothetical protein
MILSQHDRIAELADEIDTAEGFLLYWQSTEDPDLIEEAGGRIAVYETDLDNLKREHQALVGKANQRS